MKENKVTLSDVMIMCFTLGLYKDLTHFLELLECVRGHKRI